MSEIESLCVIHITDTHLLAQPDARFLGMNPELSFQTVMQQLLARYTKIDAIIHTGDLAQEATPATYARYVDYMQSLGIPFYQIPGNHDQQHCFPFSQTTAQQPLVLELGQWCIILLNSAVEGRIDGEVSAEQLSALSTILSEYAPRPTIVACHHHPMLMQSQWIDQHSLKNGKNLLTILANSPQVKIVLCGHVHQDSAQLWQHIHCLSTPSTCLQFKPLSQAFALDDIAAGYRVLKLETIGTWTSQVERLDHLPEGLKLYGSGY